MYGNLDQGRSLEGNKEYAAEKVMAFWRHMFCYGGHLADDRFKGYTQENPDDFKLDGLIADCLLAKKTGLSKHCADIIKAKQSSREVGELMRDMKFFVDNLRLKLHNGDINNVVFAMVCVELAGAGDLLLREFRRERDVLFIAADKSLRQFTVKQGLAQIFRKRSDYLARCAEYMIGEFEKLINTLTTEMKQPEYMKTTLVYNEKDYVTLNRVYMSNQHIGMITRAFTSLSQRIAKLSD